jgi:hypothetical protein
MNQDEDGQLLMDFSTPRKYHRAMTIEELATNKRVLRIKRYHEVYKLRKELYAQAGKSEHNKGRDQQV